MVFALILGFTGMPIAMMIDLSCSSQRAEMGVSDNEGPFRYWSPGWKDFRKDVSLDRPMYLQ